MDKPRDTSAAKGPKSSAKNSRRRRQGGRRVDDSFPGQRSPSFTPVKCDKTITPAQARRLTQQQSSPPSPRLL